MGNYMKFNYITCLILLFTLHDVLLCSQLLKVSLEHHDFFFLSLSDWLARSNPPSAFSLKTCYNS